MLKAGLAVALTAVAALAAGAAASHGAFPAVNGRVVFQRGGMLGRRTGRERAEGADVLARLRRRPSVEPDRDEARVRDDAPRRVKGVFDGNLDVWEMTRTGRPR
jgi:hypothetical protein